MAERTSRTGSFSIFLFLDQNEISITIATDNTRSQRQRGSVKQNYRIQTPWKVLALLARGSSRKEGEDWGYYFVIPLALCSLG